MQLGFPDLTSLLSVANELPHDDLRSPVRYAIAPDGRRWFEPTFSLEFSFRRQLARLGVILTNQCGVELAEAEDWFHAIEPQPEPLPAILPRGSEVLFRFASMRELVAVYAEVRRLTSPLQRMFTDGESHLLFVTDPPLLTLRRAFEGLTGFTAFLRRAPRTFIELNYQHPLMGRWRAPRRLVWIDRFGAWSAISATSLRIVDEAWSQSLPATASKYHECRKNPPIPITLKLKRSNFPTGLPDAFYLREEAERRLLAFVREADDRLIERFDFAFNGNEIVLRGRRDREGPPILQLDAEPFAPLLKLDQILAPSGDRLTPPLRRDILRSLFHESKDTIAILSSGESGIRVESIAVTGFRPLLPSVEYCVEEPVRKCTAWRPIEAFPLLPIIEVDEPIRPRAKRGEPRNIDDQTVEVPFGKTEITFPILPGSRPPVELPSLETLTLSAVPLAERTPQRIAEWREQIDAIEKRFLALEGELDTSERQALWPAMARLHHLLDQDAEAALCWSYALWPTHADPAMTRQWQRAEATPDWQSILTDPSPSLAVLRSAVASIVDASQHADSNLPPLGGLVRFLEAVEGRLPVRIAWLGWLALSRLAGGDILGLTRARDRLLGELHESGLNPDRDMPKFLRVSKRASGGNDQQLDSPRFRMMLTKARRWAASTVSSSLSGSETTPMSILVQLIFTYGFARFGDADTAREYLRTLPKLRGKPRTPEAWVQTAYVERIEGILDGKRPGIPLSDSLIQARERFQGRERLHLDRVRDNSLIVEPVERLNPFHDHAGQADTFTHELLRFRQLPSAERGRWFTKLLREARSLSREFRVLAAGLSFAFHTGESFALEVLGAIGPVQNQLPKFVDLHDLLRWVRFLESALALVAHYDLPAYLPELLERLQQLLRPLSSERAGWLISAMGGNSFRFLSRFGLRTEARGLLDRMTELVMRGEDVASFWARPGLNRGVMLPAMMRLAGGWFYFDMESRGRQVIEATRQELFNGNLSPDARIQLAASYASCLGNAPVAIALPCIDELFDRLPEGSSFYPFIPRGGLPIGPLRILESIVLSLATEDFSLDTTVRRLLDEDETLIRKRIHRDVREAMQRQGL